MTDAWSLYDRMIAEVPEDVLVRHVVMGAHHCLVEAECGTGVAALHRGGARLRMECGWMGRSLRELAACAKSWDFEVASVGVAALNAWHNQHERLDALGLVTDAESTDPFVFLAPVAARMAAEKGDGSRPRAVVIGHFPHLAALARREGLVALGSEDKTGLALDGAVRASAAQVSPLADLYRSDVVALAHLRNTISPAIPAEAFSSLKARLEQLGMPEVDMFLADYAPSFSLSLDEMNHSG